MEKQSNRALAFINKCIISLLGLMGLCNSCIPALAYGSPVTEYDFRGSVKDENGLPLENVKVALFFNTPKVIEDPHIDSTIFLYKILGGEPLYNHGPRYYSRSTDEEGEYTLQGECHGSQIFTIFFLKEGYEWKDTTFQWKDIPHKGKNNEEDRVGLAAIHVSLKKVTAKGNQ